jgi:hypothetical protein
MNCHILMGKKKFLFFFIIRGVPLPKKINTPTTTLNARNLNDYLFKGLG